MMLIARYQAQRPIEEEDRQIEAIVGGECLVSKELRDQVRTLKFWVDDAALIATRIESEVHGVTTDVQERY